MVGGTKLVMQRGVGRVGVVMELYGTGGRFKYSKK